MIGVRDASLATDEAYYRDNYQDYERQASPAKLDFYMQLLSRWVPAGARVFELGVGQGNFLARAKAAYRVEGVDVNEFGVKQTRARVPEARIEVGSFERIPREDPPNAVVAWDVLEHLPELDVGLRAIHAALPPAGVLAAVVPVYDGPLGWLVRRLDHDPTHVSKLGRGDWLARLAGAGFRVLEHGGILRKLVAGRAYVHLVRPQAVLRAAGSALYFVARKPAG
jgi:SAM-dependent methyltransferase